MDREGTSWKPGFGDSRPRDTVWVVWENTMSCEHIFQGELGLPDKHLQMPLKEARKDLAQTGSAPIMNVRGPRAPHNSEVPSSRRNVDAVF